MIPDKVMGSLLERMIINYFTNQMRKSYIEEKIETEEINSENNNSCMSQGNGFKKILIKHMQEVNFVTIILVSGAKCCELEGVICSVCSDCIIVINEEEKTVVPIDKIAAVKKFTSCCKSRTKKKIGKYPVICESEEKYYPGMVKENPLF